MKRLSIIFAALMLVCGVFFNICGVFFNSSVNAEGEFAVGSKLENFKLSDTLGSIKSFDDLKGEKGAVIVFLSVQCPVVKSYDERISQLAADYKAKGINVIGINSNVTEMAEKVKTHAEGKYSFPVLLDKGNVIADQFFASVTPEVFYFDATGKLLYRGAIDNSRNGDAITLTYLRDALEAGIANKEIKKATTNAVGCGIKRVAK
jgi:thiol-disulfide isomerase/thioredoxin